MSQYKLTEEIIERSHSNTWLQAKGEWYLYGIYREDDPIRCLCGHYPIFEICILQNKFNGEQVVVGNICVKKFIGLPSDKIFSAFKRIEKDIEKSLNLESIDHFHQKESINDWERGFYRDIYRKRNLTEKQNSIKKRINQKILNSFKNLKGKRKK